MGDEKKWFAKLLAKLIPKQKSSGNGAIQIGKAGPVTINQVTHHNVIQQVHPAPRQQGGREPLPVTDEQKEVLTLMKPLPDPVRITVLDFMRREFGTAMVKELQPRDLYRVRMYVLKVRQSAGF